MLVGRSDILELGEDRAGIQQCPVRLFERLTGAAHALPKPLQLDHVSLHVLQRVFDLVSPLAHIKLYRCPNASFTAP